MIKNLNYYILVLVLVINANYKLFATVGADKSVEISAIIEKNPAKITLIWKSKTNQGEYFIYKRTTGPNTKWGAPIAKLSATAIQYEDVNVIEGVEYEYKITRGITATGYIRAGIEINLKDKMGKIIFLVDSTFVNSLATELNLMEEMMTADGWFVIRQNISRSASVKQVKSKILEIYNTDKANIKALYIFGHIAVPYSGNFTADGHSGHIGAWPADVFYGEMDGNWTDTKVNSTVANHSGDVTLNYNIPGDGKYDQNMPPSPVELQVGRVDLSDLPRLSTNGDELELLRNYIVKNYNYRYKKIDLKRHAIVYDGFEYKEGTPSTDVYRHSAAFFGQNKLLDVAPDEYLQNLDTNNYLLAHSEGGGFFHGANGIGSSSDIVTYDPQAIFYTTYGSWFGDWNTTDNFLRAFLAGKTYGLTNLWNAPHHLFAQDLALGYNIGHVVKLYFNNVADTTTGYRIYITDFTFGDKESVHIGLMGDPTLRLFTVAPVDNLQISDQGTLSWSPSPDSDIVGYHVYKSSTKKGDYERISTDIITENSFTDPSPSINSWYMIRAIKLENSGSGSYYNPSQGIFIQLTQSGNNNGIPETVVYNLKTGSNLISLNHELPDMSPAAFLAPIISSTTYIKTYSEYYRPDSDESLNTLKKLSAGKAYIIRVTKNVTLSVTGIPINPHGYVENLKAGWNLLCYPYSYTSMIDTLFNGVKDQIIQIKDFQGKWVPGSVNNSLELMLPKQSYFIRMSKATSVVWE